MRNFSFLNFILTINFSGRFILNIVVKDSKALLEPSLSVFLENIVDIIDKIIETINSLPLIEDIVCYTENTVNFTNIPHALF